MTEVKKFALFEFKDNSVEVGPLEWVKGPIGGEISMNDNIRFA